MTFLCARARILREVVRRGWISDVSPGVIKTGGGGYTNNFMGVCCLQSSALDALKLQCQLQTQFLVSLKCCLRGKLLFFSRSLK